MLPIQYRLACAGGQGKGQTCFFKLFSFRLQFIGLRAVGVDALSRWFANPRRPPSPDASLAALRRPGLDGTCDQRQTGSGEPLTPRRALACSLVWLKRWMAQLRPGGCSWPCLGAASPRRSQADLRVSLESLQLGSHPAHPRCLPRGGTRSAGAGWPGAGLRDLGTQSRSFDFESSRAHWAQEKRPPCWVDGLLAQRRLNRGPNVVAIGGGTGLATLLSWPSKRYSQATSQRL